MVTNVSFEPHSAISIPQSAIRNPISSSLVDPLKRGTILTFQVGRGHPHEGNLFDHLYSRRAFQRAYDLV